MTSLAVSQAQFSLPKLNRTAPPGRPSEYREKFAALEAGSTQCVIIEVPNTGDVEADKENVAKATQRLSSAVSQYRKATGDRALLTVRSFSNDDGSTVVGVWKLVGTMKDKAPKKAAVTADAQSGADGAGTDLSGTDAPQD